MKRSTRHHTGPSAARGVESALPDIVARTAPPGAALAPPENGHGSIQSIAGGPRIASGSLAETKPARRPTHDDIARRAYELYLSRGSQDGRAEDDWLRAERELCGPGSSSL